MPLAGCGSAVHDDDAKANQAIVEARKQGVEMEHARQKAIREKERQKALTERIRRLEAQQKRAARQAAEQARRARQAPAPPPAPSRSAYAGTSSDGGADDAAIAYEMGKTTLGPDFRQPLAPRESSGFSTVDTALDALSRSSGAVKKQVLEACAAVIGADGKMTIEEAELLRTIADALDCPMPPPAAQLMPA